MRVIRVGNVNSASSKEDEMLYLTQYTLYDSMRCSWSCELAGPGRSFAPCWSRNEETGATKCSKRTHPTMFPSLCTECFYLDKCRDREPCSAAISTKQIEIEEKLHLLEKLFRSIPPIPLIPEIPIAVETLYPIGRGLVVPNPGVIHSGNLVGDPTHGPNVEDPDGQDQEPMYQEERFRGTEGFSIILAEGENCGECIRYDKVCWTLRDVTQMGGASVRVVNCRSRIDGVGVSFMCASCLSALSCSSALCPVNERRRLDRSPSVGTNCRRCGHVLQGDVSGYGYCPSCRFRHVITQDSSHYTGPHDVCRRCGSLLSTTERPVWLCRACDAETPVRNL